MLKGKVAVITGGSRGIGKATAQKLASLGADIAVVYRSEDAAAAELCSELQQQGVKAEPFKLDVSVYDDAKETVDRIMETFGQHRYSGKLCRHHERQTHRNDEGRRIRCCYKCQPQGYIQHDQTLYACIHEAEERQDNQFAPPFQVS